MRQHCAVWRDIQDVRYILFDMLGEHAGLAATVGEGTSLLTRGGDCPAPG